MSLEVITKLSNRYGSDPAYVLAGGGNTSYKNDGIMYVKGSGTSLATIKPEGFVAMYMDKLTEMGCENVRGFVWYVFKGKIVEVK